VRAWLVSPLLAVMLFWRLWQLFEGIATAGSWLSLGHVFLCCEHATLLALLNRFSPRGNHGDTALFARCKGASELQLFVRVSFVWTHVAFLQLWALRLHTLWHGRWHARKCIHTELRVG
jgi:hypothetical protein